MSVKSLEELRKLREEAKGKLSMRKDGEGDYIELMVGMATCGIAAGARTTLNVLLDEIQNKNIENIKVVQVGCLGYCHSEPTVQINEPGKESIIYGNVDEKRAREIINKHIINHELIDDAVIIETYKKP
ncbi:MAG: (2Fe-2S) ferredoxin domain-containing protein [Bacillota bacterium]|nr:(2Fe-2S) ferredoxin domain-containing protein [Bacillota bacterium]